MAYLLKWLLSYGERFQLIESQSDESTVPQVQISHSSLVLSKLQYLLKHLKEIFNRLAKKIDGLESNTKENLILIGIAIMAFLLYRLLKKDPKNPSPPSNHKSVKAGTKRTSSLLSMKQYESHSNSDNSELEQELNMKINKKGEEMVKKTIKENREFYTDVETEHNNRFEILDSKRDKFFFSVVGSYKKASEKCIETGEDMKEIYNVEYKRYRMDDDESVDEGSEKENELINNKEREDKDKSKMKEKAKNV